MSKQIFKIDAGQGKFQRLACPAAEGRPTSLWNFVTNFGLKQAAYV